MIKIKRAEVKGAFPDADWELIEMHALNVTWCIMHGPSGMDDMTEGVWQGTEHALGRIRELLEQGGVPRAAYWDEQTDMYAGEDEIVPTMCIECDGVGRVWDDGDDGDDDVECDNCEGAGEVYGNAGVKFDPWQVLLRPQVLELL